MRFRVSSRLWGAVIGSLLMLACASSASAATLSALPSAPGVGQYYAIAEGPDGRMWFSGQQYTSQTTTGRVGAVKPATGEVEIVAAGIPNAELRSIAAGSDGNVWAGDFKNGRVVRITPAGAWTAFTISPETTSVTSLVSGGDGRLWMTVGTLNGPRIAFLDPATGDATVTSAPGGSSLVPGPGGRLYFISGAAVQSFAPLVCTALQCSLTTEVAADTPIGLLAASSTRLFWTTGKQITIVDPVGNSTHTVSPVPDPAFSDKFALSRMTTDTAGDAWAVDLIENRVIRVLANGDVAEFRFVDSDAIAIGARSNGELTTVSVYGALNRIVPDALAQPTVSTEAVTGVTGAQATLQALVDPKGSPTGYRFYHRRKYGSSWYPWVATSTVAVSPVDAGAQAVAATVTGLSTATTYEVLAVAVGTTTGRVTGKVTTFTTPGPSAGVPQVKDVGKKGATFQASVDPNGVNTTYHFEYRLDSYQPTVSTSTPTQNAGSGLDPVQSEATVTGLVPDTDYEVRLVVEGAGGTQESSWTNFNTLALSPPSISFDGAVSPITPVDAKVNLWVTPSGSTEIKVQYGTTTAYGQETLSKAITTPGGQKAAFTLSDLTPGTTYHAQAVATNADGESKTADVTFATPAAVPEASLSTATLTFGSKTIGTSSNATVTLKNTGNIAFTVSSVALAAGSSDRFTVKDEPACGMLAVNATCTIDVTFKPLVAGPLTGTVLIATDKLPDRTIALSGTGYKPPASATVSPTLVSFGTHQAGTSPTSTVVFKNTGNHPFEVTAVTIGAGDSWFSIASHTCGPLAAQASCSITLTFKPDTGNRAANLIITTDELAPINVSVTGTGKTPDTDPPAKKCANTIDDDNDGKTDWPNDPGCTSASDDDETNPPAPTKCANGLDDDNDGKTDSEDPGCTSASDNDETNPVVTGKPKNLSAPAIRGVARVRHPLTCRRGTWTAPSILTVRWMRNGKPIKRATSVRYRTLASDRGKRIACRVTATNAAGRTAKTSKARTVRSR